MRNLWVIFIIMVIMAIDVSAKEITLAINQSEYYFLVGQDSLVPLEVKNTYGRQIGGMLSYTITQEVNHGGVHYSSTNTQSKSFTMPDGEETISLGFGTSDAPLALRVSLSFSYTEREERVVDLNDILVHFVSDESQKKEDQKRKESSSQEVEQNSEEEQQSALSQKMQQMQEQMSQIFGNQQQAHQDARQRVQNNQMAQDSSALKQQLEKQMQEQQKMREEFKKSLENNKEFMEQHQELADNGYKQSSENLDPINNTSGDFKINYEKEGETASLKGSMENGGIREIQKTSSEDTKKLVEQLKRNERFQKYNEILRKENFEELQNPEIIHQGNQTDITVNYKNEKNETAAIKARIENDEITDVKLGRENHLFYYVLTIILLIIGSFVYWKYFRKSEEEIRKEISEKPVDYRKESLKLLEEAKGLFRKGKEKDAYGKAGEAIRFYYSYKLGIKKELTNTELVKNLKKHNVEYSETQKCLNLCGLVEFAKYKSNKEDFGEIIRLGEGIIR